MIRYVKVRLHSTEPNKIKETKPPFALTNHKSVSWAHTTTQHRDTEDRERNDGAGSSQTLLFPQEAHLLQWRFLPFYGYISDFSGFYLLYPPLLDSDPFNFSVVYASRGEISFHCKDLIFLLFISHWIRCFIKWSTFIFFFDQWIRQLNAPLEEIDPEIADIIELEKARQWKVIIFIFHIEGCWKVEALLYWFGISVVVMRVSGIWAYTVRELHLCLGYGSCGLCYD